MTRERSSGFACLEKAKFKRREYFPPGHHAKIALSSGKSCALIISSPMPNRLPEAVSVKLYESITVAECACVILDKKCARISLDTRIR